jgi:hypothetical protein
MNSTAVAHMRLAFDAKNRSADSRVLHFGVALWQSHH